jgi:putative FmdB family regulatory protein
MPFYEYECPSCRYYLEVLQKVGAAPMKKCPSCGKGGFKKLVSAPVFRLKGAGWYETDFKSDKDKQRNLAGAERDEAPAGGDTKLSTDLKASPPDKTAAEPKAAADAKVEAKAEAKPDARPADKNRAERKPAGARKSSTVRRPAGGGSRGPAQGARGRLAARKSPGRGGKRR